MSCMGGWGKPLSGGQIPNERPNIWGSGHDVKHNWDGLGSDSDENTKNNKSS